MEYSIEVNISLLRTWNLKLVLPRQLSTVNNYCYSCNISQTCFFIVPTPSFSIITLRNPTILNILYLQLLHIKILGYVVAPSFTPLGMRPPLLGIYAQVVSSQALSTRPLDAMPPSQARVCLYSALIISQGLLTESVFSWRIAKREDRRKSQVEFHNKALMTGPSQGEKSPVAAWLNLLQNYQTQETKSAATPRETQDMDCKGNGFQTNTVHVFLFFLPVYVGGCVCLYVLVCASVCIIELINNYKIMIISLIRIFQYL